jgi:hypothetical protein
MFLDGQEGIQAGLHGDESGQGFMNLRCLPCIAGLQRPPQRNEGANQVRPGHGADHAVLVRFNQGDPAGAFEDTRLAMGGLQQLDETRHDGTGLRLE